MRALITGASGFIGSHLVSALEQQGSSVRCLVRRTSRVASLSRSKVELCYGDVRDQDSLHRAVSGVDSVYHLAGLTRALSRGELWRVNVAGVENVARACARQPNPPVLVLVSSLAAAGPSRPDRPRREVDPPAPVSLYGRSKLAGEQAAARWAGRVPMTVVRPPIVLGGGDPNGLVMFRMIVRRGVHVVPAMGSSRVAIIHACDLVQALLHLARLGLRLAPPDARDASPAQGLYFVADSQQPAYADLGHLIGTTAGRHSVRVVHIHRPWVYLGGALGEWIGRVRGKPLLTNLDKFKEATAGCWTCSNDRIRTTLHFTPQRPLADRLRETTDWYRQAGWL
jgi:nucleoside-diphosphate-sugar epimerase